MTLSYYAHFNSIAQNNIIPQKGTIIIPFRHPNGFFNYKVIVYFSFQ